MKKTIALILLTCGMAFGQEAPKQATPELNLKPVVAALQAENSWLKHKVDLLQAEVALMEATKNVQQQLNQNEVAKPKAEAIPVPVKK